MSDDSDSPDDDNIPLLENPLTLADLEGLEKPETPGAAGTSGTPPPEPTTQALAATLLQSAVIQGLLDTLAEDLQKLVSAKMEDLLKEHLAPLIKQATEDSIPLLTEDIRARLQLALPGLLAELVERAGPSDGTK